MATRENSFRQQLAQPTPYQTQIPSTLLLPRLELQYSLLAPVAQLDRASDCGSEGRAFESRRVHIFPAEL